jgi:hypothetical protein
MTVHRHVFNERIYSGFALLPKDNISEDTPKGLYVDIYKCTNGDCPAEHEVLWSRHRITAFKKRQQEAA